MPAKGSSEQAAQYLDNLSVEFTEVSEKSKGAANLLSTASRVIRKQREEQQALQKELDAVKADLETVKKLLSRTTEIARTDKSGAVTLRANVLGSLEAAVKVLDRAAAAKKPPAP